MLVNFSLIITGYAENVIAELFSVLNQLHELGIILFIFKNTPLIFIFYNILKMLEQNMREQLD